MQGEFSYEYTPAVVKLACKRFMSRRLGGFMILFGLIAVLGVLFLILGIGTPRSAAILIGVLIGVPASIGFAWWRFLQRSVAVCESMPDRSVVVRIEPDSISFQTSEHATTIKWSRIIRVWQFPDVLLLFTYDKNSAYTLLPTASIGEDLSRFLLDKLREHGCEVS